MPGHGRTWELVTAGPTNGVGLLAERTWSADGDHVVYASAGPMPGAPSGDVIAYGVATRTPDGWTRQAIGHPFAITTADLRASTPLAVSSDLSTWLWSGTQPLLPGAPAAPLATMYRRGPDGVLSLLGGIGSFTLVTVSDDVSHVVFQSSEHLLPADAGRTFGGDAYEFAGNQLRMVSVDSGGTPLSACGTNVGNGDPVLSALGHAVSRDGERIFFAAPVNGCDTPQRVFLREHGTFTTEVSVSHCTRPDCNDPQDVVFAGATPDGEHVFLVTAQQLTDDDADTSGDLYRYDLANGALTRLSAGAPGVETEVRVPVRSSDDGAVVYFRASDQLVPGQGPTGPGVFVSDQGRLRSVAPAGGLDMSLTEVSADGRTLAFATGDSLLPSDTDGNVDVYRFDADDDALTQASLGQGAAGNGAFDVAFRTRGSGLGNAFQRFMSADGAHLAFVTAEPLVAADANAAPDVYEWTAAGLALVSPGASGSAAAYGGISADGRSVFFSTTESLTAGDGNGGDQDLYAARLGGGFPAALPPPSPCQGDACQGPPAARTTRRPPETLGHVEQPAGPLQIRAPARRARQRPARDGRLTVLVDAPAAGRVSLRAFAVVRGRTTLVAQDEADARGTVRLQLRLTTAARRALAHRHLLQLRLVARQPAFGTTARLRLTLRSGR